MTRRKIRDMAVALALLGPWFLTIPMLFQFESQSGLLSIPTIVLFIFCGWIILIVLARILASRMVPDRHAVGPNDPEA